MKKAISRRQILGIGVAGLAGGLTLNQHRADAQAFDSAGGKCQELVVARTWRRATAEDLSTLSRCRRACRAEDYVPVVVPNGAALPFKIVDGVKVFHLIAEEIDHAFDRRLAREVLGIQWPGE